MRVRLSLTLLLGMFSLAALYCATARGQGSGSSLPPTPSETLSGKRVVLAQALRGHSAVVVAGFSKDAGEPCGLWAKALRADPALAGTPIYQVASLEQAPGFVRGMIKSAMRKGLSVAEQDNFLILTQEETLWRTYFGVTAEKEPYIVYFDAAGKVLWHGHGDAKELEPLLSKAKSH